MADLSKDDLRNLLALCERERRRENAAVLRLESRGGKTGATTSAVERHLDNANMIAGLAYRLHQLAKAD